MTCGRPTLAEDLGVEHRGAGRQDERCALRDMVQNHLTQLVTVVGMEVPRPSTRTPSMK